MGLPGAAGKPNQAGVRDFAIKYSQQLALNRAKKAKSLDSPGRWRGDSVAVDLAKGELEREAS